MVSIVKHYSIIHNSEDKILVKSLYTAGIGGTQYRACYQVTILAVNEQIAMESALNF